MKRIPITAVGAEKLREEIRVLKTESRPRVIQAISEARAHGDLKENAEYHGQREAQGLLQAKINNLRSKLARASIVDPATMPKDEVGFGATVLGNCVAYVLGQRITSKDSERGGRRAPS